MALGDWSVKDPPNHDVLVPTHDPRWPPCDTFWDSFLSCVCFHLRNVLKFSGSFWSCFVEALTVVFLPFICSSTIMIKLKVRKNKILVNLFYQIPTNIRPCLILLWTSSLDIWIILNDEIIVRPNVSFGICIGCWNPLHSQRGFRFLSVIDTDVSFDHFCSVPSRAVYFCSAYHLRRFDRKFWFGFSSDKF